VERSKDRTGGVRVLDGCHWLDPREPIPCNTNPSLSSLGALCDYSTSLQPGELSFCFLSFVARCYSTVIRTLTRRLRENRSLMAFRTHRLFGNSPASIGYDRFEQHGELPYPYLLFLGGFDIRETETYASMTRSINVASFRPKVPSRFLVWS
jgi:hypothetical protein